MIGIISDTHDNIPQVLKAVQKFKERNVELVFHLGDIVAPATVLFFGGLKMKFLKGNCDGDIEMIKKKIEEISGEWLGLSAEMKIKNKSIGLCHGKDRRKLDSMINCRKFDYVLHGHTHQRRDDHVGNTRVINPGGHYNSPSQPEHTIAFLDAEKDEVEFVEIK